MDNWELITPDANNDWLNQRVKYPINALTLTGENGVFSISSLGAVTKRDSIAYGSSKIEVEYRAQKAVTIFNRQVSDSGTIPDKKIRKDEIAVFKWHGIVKRKLKTFSNNGEHLEYELGSVVKCAYRPFFTQYLDYNPTLNGSHSRLSDLFLAHMESITNLGITFDEQNDPLSSLASYLISDSGNPPPQGRVLTRFSHTQLRNHSGGESRGRGRLQNG